jgi:hypothetical protein
MLHPEVTSAGAHETEKFALARDARGPSSTYVRRWPPLLWPVISIASLLILMGSHGRPAMVAVGLALALLAFGVAVYLAFGDRSRGPRPAAAYWAFGVFSLIYIVGAIAGATIGWAYALAAILAGVIPLTAVSLIIATATAKSDSTGDGLTDAAADAGDDPFPGVGVDHSTPLGDSPEISDIPPDVERRQRFEAARERRRA